MSRETKGDKILIQSHSWNFVLNVPPERETAWPPRNGTSLFINRGERSISIEQRKTGDEKDSNRRENRSTENSLLFFRTVFHEFQEFREENWKTQQQEEE